MFPRVHHPFLLWEGCNQAARSRYNTRLAQLLPRLIYSPCVVDWNILNQMDCGEAIDEMLMIKLFEAGTNELCGRAFSWTLLEFAKRLGLYNLDEIKEEGFDVYFQDGLRQHCFEGVAQNDHLWLVSKNNWLIARWMKRKGAGSQKESMICYGQFITKIAKRINLLTEEVWNGLSASIYCGALDTTTFRELIDSEGRLIPEAPEPGVPRVVIPRPPRTSMQDFYKRMSNMEIRQGAIERMSYRQSYHWDKYGGVFKHMAEVYSVPLQGAYNPPGYDQQQYDQYYQ
ncbi:hypothetical protein Tco_0216558 [Tanacetum coccineum]